MRVRTCICGLLAAGSIVAATPACAASVFTFSFDNQGIGGNYSSDGPLVGPIVGTGTFTTSADLAAGTYDILSLPDFSVNFSFADGTTLSTADITTPLTGVAVRIADFAGGGERLFFTEGSGVGVNGGSYGGAVDLQNASGFLSFEPTYAGGNFLYYTGGSSGRYLAISDAAVPEPATWALIILGFGAVGSMLRRRRPNVALSYC